MKNVVVAVDGRRDLCDADIGENSAGWQRSDGASEDVLLLRPRCVSLSIISSQFRRLRGASAGTASCDANIRMICFRSTIKLVSIPLSQATG